MSYSWKRVQLPGALVACCWIASWGNLTDAQEGPALADQPAATVTPSPVMPEPAPTEVMPAVPEQLAPPPTASAQSAESVRALTCPVDYRTHLGARRMYRHSGEIQVCEVAKNPVDCCLYQIPLCIPCCCMGEPTVESHCGPFGRGVVEYCWSCGFRATVVFRARGDVVVHYGA